MIEKYGCGHAPKASRMDYKLSDEEMAEIFHDEYEKAAKMYGWSTQKKCSVGFWELPEANRKTMIATIIQVRKLLERRINKNKRRFDEKR